MDYLILAAIGIVMGLFTGYDILNIPVWKHLDSIGNTIVKGISPRINLIFVHIFMGDVRSKIDCIEVTKEEMEGKRREE